MTTSSLICGLSGVRERGKLIVIASHSRENIALLSDTVIQVSEGRLREAAL